MGKEKKRGIGVVCDREDERARDREKDREGWKGVVGILL